MKPVKNGRGLMARRSMLPSSWENLFRPWNSWFEDGGFPGMESIPPVNIEENQGDFTLKIAAPGLKKEDFKVNIEGDLITISAETKSEQEEKDRTYSRKEFNYSSFSRSFTLPENARGDKVLAKYQEGVLFVIIPKKEVTPKAAALHVVVQ